MQPRIDDELFLLKWEKRGNFCVARFILIWFMSVCTFNLVILLNPLMLVENTRENSWFWRSNQEK